MSEHVEVTISAGGKREEPGPMRLTLTLAIAGIIAGAALASVYEITRPIIEANNQRALRRAVLTVVPGSEKVQALAYRDGQLVAIERAADTTDPVVYGAFSDSGRFVGYAVDAEGPGFQDTIHLLFGYDPDTRTITGMQVLESRETPGLGDRIYKDPKFVAQFEALAVKPDVVLVKGGAKAGNEVDAITGATISSKAVVNIIKAGNAQWLDRLDTAATLQLLLEEQHTDVTPEADK